MAAELLKPSRRGIIASLGALFAAPAIVSAATQSHPLVTGSIEYLPQVNDRWPWFIRVETPSNYTNILIANPTKEFAEARMPAMLRTWNEAIRAHMSSAPAEPAPGDRQSPQERT